MWKNSSHGAGRPGTVNSWPARSHSSSLTCPRPNRAMASRRGSFVAYSAAYSRWNWLSSRLISGTCWRRIRSSVMTRVALLSRNFSMVTLRPLIVTSGIG
jgi:hypothetical protein